MRGNCFCTENNSGTLLRSTIRSTFADGWIGSYISLGKTESNRQRFYLLILTQKQLQPWHFNFSIDILGHNEVDLSLTKDLECTLVNLFPSGVKFSTCLGNEMWETARLQKQKKEGHDSTHQRSLASSHRPFFELLLRMVHLLPLLEINFLSN